MSTMNLETLSRAVDPRGEIVDAGALRAVTASDILSIGAGLSRTRAAWVRLQVADAIGHSEPSKQWAQGVDFATIQKGLESLAVDLAHAAVASSGPAHEAEFSGWNTHLRNAFPCIKGVSCRINAKGNDIAPTKAYSAAPVFKTAARGQMRAAIGILSTAEKRDITDKVQTVQEEPGDAPSIADLFGQVPLSDDTKSVPATLPMSDHYDIVGAAKADSWSEGHAAGQASMSPKIERLYAEVARLQRALDSERVKNAALIANARPAPAGRKAKA